MPLPIDLIGVPFNSAGTSEGVARAPGALRRANLVDAVRGAGLAVEDRGDVGLAPPDTSRDPESGLIAPATLAVMIREVREAVTAARARGAFPLVIGGDCPILLGCLGPGGRETGAGLLFVDGHEDAWPPTNSTTGEAADMELGFALGLTIAGLPGWLAAEFPRLDATKVVAIGPRDQDELQAAGVHSIDDQIRVVRQPELAVDPVQTVRDSAGVFASGGWWWLHTDLDVLSTESLPSVDYRQAGGLDWQQTD